MLDPRVTKLAENVCSHSTRLNAEDRLLVHAIDIPDEVVAEFVRVAQGKGADVAVRMESARVKRRLMLGMTERNAKFIAAAELAEMQQTTAYIALRGGDNTNEAGDVPGETLQLWQKHYTQPVVFGCRVPKTKWCALRWPSPSMAQQAKQPTDVFEDFYFDVCTLDYGKMQRAAQPLQDLMDRTDHVRITGPGTEFEFSIKGVGAKSCHGERNIPDGECFSCPVKGSANGTVQYNTVNLYQGTEFNNIRFVVKDGVITEADAGEHTEKLNAILDTDEGARGFGEWSLGYNPHVLHPMKDTLFDEKIAGSFHLTPGNSYEGKGGGQNASGVHWDIVCIQRPEYGGGEVWFDGVLVRKDGLFVLPELQGLNPDRLRDA